MVLCQGCCPVGIEVELSEVKVEVRLPCFCELCNQLTVDPPRTPSRTSVRGAFLMDGRMWRQLAVQRFDAMSRQPELWARNRAEFISILMTWLEVLSYSGEIASLPTPSFFAEQQGGIRRLFGIEPPLDGGWALRTIDKARSLLPPLDLIFG